MEWRIVDTIINLALEEDLGWGDVTTESTIHEAAVSEGVFIAKEAGIIAGIDVAERVFKLVDDSLVFDKMTVDGEHVEIGEIIATISGSSRSILKGERTALNLIQRMSGIASETNRYVKLTAGTNARIVDTRKTMPGLRYLDKYSVRAGGGKNHRYNLSDLILIKDNHIKAAGGIKKAVQAAEARLTHALKIEVEVENLAMLEETLASGADIIMLDNMTPEMMKEAVEIVSGSALLEASGNISLEPNSDRYVRTVAMTGVDIISVGAITHSVKSMDISLKFK